MEVRLQAKATLVAAIAQGLTRYLGVSVPVERVHMPSREAHSSCMLPGVDAMALQERLAADGHAGFPTVWGAAPIAQVWVKNGWLLFRFTEELFAAITQYVMDTWPAPEGDHGDLALNGMLRLARQPGEGCPVPEMQQYLLELLCLPENATEHRLAECGRHFMALWDGTLPKDRAAKKKRCGSAAAAAARLYALHLGRE